MYFAIAGKNISLSKKELELVWKIVSQEWKIIFFETENFDKCKFLAGFVKIWEVISKKEFISMDKKLLWTNIHLKPSEKLVYNFKRYKHIDLLKSDIEVKKKWTEAIFFKSMPDKVWIVKFYQNISLYETIDFDKPIRSMWIWMMPAKLTHLMLNLLTWLNYNQTIYDPFAGLGTTLMIASYFENNIIWSDINITPAKQNFKWWLNHIKKEKDLSKQNYFLFKHDITKPFSKKIVNFTDYVVTEGYLWPIVKKNLTLQEAQKMQQHFENIYIQWIKNLLSLEKLKKIIITFPAYRLKDNSFFILENIYEQINKFAKIQLFDEIYIRQGQKVWRQLAIIYQ